MINAAPPSAVNHDFFPLHSTRYPFGFLNENQKELQKGIAKQSIKEYVQLSASVFGQTASVGRNQDKDLVNLGDVQGRFNMLGLLYGSVPTGQTRPALLTTAAAENYHIGGTRPLSYENFSDTQDLMGHFSVPLKYRKVGARMVFSVRVLDEFVITAEGGVSDIRQTYTKFDNIGRTSVALLNANPETVYGDKTISDENIALDLTKIDTYLMEPSGQIFTQMGLNVQDFHETGPEDVFVSLTWRHNKHINNQDDSEESDYEYSDDEEWEKFILTPFVKFTTGIGIGKQKNNALAFSLPFGNNGHHSVNITAGLSMDFYNDIEVTFDAGATHFFNREINGMFIPNNEHQTGIYPFKTDVNYKPGKTWHVGAAINAYHFLDKVSCYAQYIYVNHSKDSIALITADSAFKPWVLEDQTKWTVQAVNIGFNFDLSPYITAGCAWQAPISRRGAYKTNTLMVSLVGTF
jgi:hypothetical protein